MGEAVVAVLVMITGVLGLVVVFAKNPISSAFSLVGLMLTLAAIYAVIGAHFIAALQAIVYAGAVMVLFVFSIMLLNLNEEKGEIEWTSWKTPAAIAVSLGIFGCMAAAVQDWSLEKRLPAVDVWTLDYIKRAGGNVVALSAELFSKAYIQFEVISLLILVAIVAALVLAKRKVD